MAKAIINKANYIDLGFASIDVKSLKRLNSNIYKNIFEHIIFDLYDIQTKINIKFTKENKIFQYNHGFNLYDLLYLDNNGVYHRGLANREQYNVLGIISEIIDEHQFILMTYGQIEYDRGFDSDSGILYLSDTHPGQISRYEDITNTFYTPVGFYNNNKITINILDSSVGIPMKLYQDKILDGYKLNYLTRKDRQEIVEEVLKHA